MDECWTAEDIVVLSFFPILQAPLVILLLCLLHSAVGFALHSAPIDYIRLDISLEPSAPEKALIKLPGLHS